MADTKISALTDMTDPEENDALPICDASDLATAKRCTLGSLRNFLQSVGGMLYVKRLGTSASTSLTTMTEATNLTVIVPAGVWRFDYWLLMTSDVTTNTFKIAVDHSGTTTSFVYWMLVLGNSDLGSVGTWDQEINLTTGVCLSSFGTRVKNTTLGPGVSVDAAASSLLVRVSGLFQSTTTGSLKLLWGSEVGGVLSSLNLNSTLLVHNLTNTV